MFGFPHSEVDQDLPVAFLRKLFAIGYLGEGKRPTVSFEVKPIEIIDARIKLARRRIDRTPRSARRGAAARPPGGSLKLQF